MSKGQDIELGAAHRVSDDRKQNYINFWSRKRIYVPLIVIGSIGLLLLLILVPLSFSYVDPTTMAFSKNTVTNYIYQDTVYQNGRYMWGPAYATVVFPTTFQWIIFRGDNLLVFSKGGVEFSIEMDVAYRLDPNQLSDIYTKFALTYHERYVDVVKASIKNTATLYTVDEFLSNRDIIVDYMLQNINVALRPLFQQIEKGKVFLRRVVFPANIRTKFEQTAVQELENQRAEIVQEVQIIHKETALIIEDYEANITIVKNSASAEATTLVLSSEEEAKNIVQQSVGAGINGLIRALNATSDEARKSLFDLFTIQDSPSSVKTVLGDLSAIIKV